MIGQIWGTARNDLAAWLRSPAAIAARAPSIAAPQPEEVELEDLDVPSFLRRKRIF